MMMSSISSRTYTFHKGNGLAGSSLANGVGSPADKAKVEQARLSGNYII